MPALGLEVPKKEVDKLFDEWDTSGDGSLSIKELQKILRSAPKEVPGEGGSRTNRLHNAVTATQALQKLSLVSQAMKKK